MPPLLYHLARFASHALGSHVSSRHTCHRMDTDHRMVHNFVPIGDGAPYNKQALETTVAYRARVPLAHSLPSLVIRIREHIDRPSQGLPAQANVAARISSVRW